MNCKPNEMATIVRTTVPEPWWLPESLLGISVQVVALEPGLALPTWLLKQPILWRVERLCRSLAGNTYYPGDIMTINLMPDCVLQPWRGLEQHGERAEPISLMQPRGKSIFQQMRDALDMSELSRVIGGLK